MSSYVALWSFVTSPDLGSQSLIGFSFMLIPTCCRHRMLAVLRFPGARLDPVICELPRDSVTTQLNQLFRCAPARFITANERAIQGGPNSTG